MRDVGDDEMGIGSDIGCRGCKGDCGGGDTGSSMDAANEGEVTNTREGGEMEGIIVCDSSSSVSCT
jgi:hypothetical protein